MKTNKRCCPLSIHDPVLGTSSLFLLLCDAISGTTDSSVKEQAKHPAELFSLLISFHSGSCFARCKVQANDLLAVRNQCNGTVLQDFSILFMPRSGT